MEIKEAVQERKSDESETVIKKLNNNIAGLNINNQEDNEDDGQPQSSHNGN